MAFKYSKLQRTADKLLKKFGKRITISSGSASYYDVDTSENITAPVSIDNGTGVVLDYGSDEIDGTIIIKGHKKLLLSAANGTNKPKVGDTVNNGEEWTVVNPIKEIKPADTVVMYICGLKK